MKNNFLEALSYIHPVLARPPPRLPLRGVAPSVRWRISRAPPNAWPAAPVETTNQAIKLNHRPPIFWKESQTVNFSPPPQPAIRPKSRECYKKPCHLVIHKESKVKHRRPWKPRWNCARRTRSPAWRRRSTKWARIKAGFQMLDYRMKILSGGSKDA